MKKVIAALLIVATSVAYGAAQLFAMVPTTIGTAVIAEKTEGGNSGGQAAILLPENLTSKQGRLLAEAYEIAKADGHKHPELVQAILLQETMAGGMKAYRVANPGPEAYFGVMQIKLGAAKDVLGVWPDLYKKFGLQSRADDEIKANLILNDKFNMSVASKYLLVLQQRYGYSGHALMVAYNKGPGGAQGVDPAENEYAQGALSKLAARKGKKL
jgi:hypothetical protein